MGATDFEFHKEAREVLKQGLNQLQQNMNKGSGVKTLNKPPTNKETKLKKNQARPSSGFGLKAPRGFCTSRQIIWVEGKTHWEKRVVYWEKKMKHERPGTMIAWLHATSFMFTNCLLCLIWFVYVFLRLNKLGMTSKQKDSSSKAAKNFSPCMGEKHSYKAFENHKSNVSACISALEQITAVHWTFVQRTVHRLGSGTFKQDPTKASKDNLVSSSPWVPAMICWRRPGEETRRGANCSYEGTTLNSTSKALTMN